MSYTEVKPSIKEEVLDCLKIYKQMNVRNENAGKKIGIKSLNTYDTDEVRLSVDGS